MSAPVHVIQRLLAWLWVPLPGQPDLLFLAESRSRSYCRCNEPDAPLTARGYCVACADAACADGGGDDVGLPVPTTGAAAMRAFDDHIRARRPECLAQPTWCLVCALRTSTCTECGLDVADIEADETEHAGHVVVDGSVLRGCEGYLLPAARAAALIGQPQ